MAPERVDVVLGDRSYPVWVDERSYAGLEQALAGVASRFVLVTDDNVGPLWASPVAAALSAVGELLGTVTIPAGEVHKTLATWSSIVDGLLDAGADRRTAVVALGGGVVGDMSGFAAACTLRGMPFVQLPTTLLAMVDASVGGKTAVDHPRGKNLIGAFHQPSLVFADLAALRTLPAEELRSGLGEVVKTALIADEQLFGHLEARAGALGRGEGLGPVVRRCVEIKAGVVSRDEREEGERALLNAGHTIGHAWEAAGAYAGLRHGEAVALGLVTEASWAVALGLCAPDVPARVAALCRALGLPGTPPDVDADTLITFVRMDKKSRSGTIRVPLPIAIGRADVIELPMSTVERLIIGTM